MTADSKIFLVKGTKRFEGYINEYYVKKKIEISPSDLELLKKLIKYCFEYGIVDDSDDSLTSIHLKALLKKLESL